MPIYVTTDFTLADPTDQSKSFGWDASQIPPDTRRVYGAPNLDGMVALLDGGPQTFIYATTFGFYPTVNFTGGSDPFLAAYDLPGTGTLTFGTTGALVSNKRQNFQVADGTIALLSDIPTVAGVYQPIDSDLTAIAALATTSYGRSFLTQADAAASRTYLGLGTLATQSGTFSGTSSGTNTGDQTIDAIRTWATLQTFGSNASLDASTLTAGTLPVTRGGTGVGAASTGSGGVVLDTGATLTAPAISDFTSANHTHGSATFGGQLVPATCFAAGNRTGTGKAVLDTSPTIVTPTIASFTNATHNHSNAAGGGQIALTTGVTGTLPVANGGTGVTTSTGTTNAVLSGSPTIVTPTIADLTNMTHAHGTAAGGGQLVPGTIFAAGDKTGTGKAVLDASPTIVTPTVASLTNMTHSHQNAAGGGLLDAAALGSGVIAAARLVTAPVNLTGQTADIGATNLATVAGAYLVTVTIECTTADAVTPAGSVNISLGWTDDVGATAQGFTRTLTTTGRQSPIATIVNCYLASGNLTYTVTHSGSYGTAQYALRIRTIAL